MSTCPKCGERAEAIGRSGCDAYRCITCGLTFEETAAEAVARTATVTGVEKMPHCEKPCRYCGHKYERGCEHCSAQLAQTHGLRRVLYADRTTRSASGSSSAPSRSNSLPRATDAIPA